MKETDKIVIHLSKTKITMLTLGAIVFVILGVLFILHPERFLTIFFKNEEAIRITGFASVGFFGLCAIFYVVKLFDNKPGLIIDKNGILDNSSGISSGLIAWKDIQDINVLEIVRQKIILIIVSNPEDYIVRQKRGFKIKISRLNYNKYETPVQITANGLKIGFNELLAILESNLTKYKDRK
jgi:hypothetical protein